MRIEEIDLEACYAARRNAGVYFILGEPVRELVAAPADGGRRISALTTDRCRIESENAVLATGAWTGRLIATSGCELPVEPVRGQAAVARVGTLSPHACSIPAAATSYREREGRSSPVPRWNVSGSTGIPPSRVSGRCGPVSGIGNLWVATGHYRNGMLLAPVTAKLISRWICSGDPGRDLTPFLPDRFL